LVCLAWRPAVTPRALSPQIAQCDMALPNQCPLSAMRWQFVFGSYRCLPNPAAAILFALRTTR